MPFNQCRHNDAYPGKCIVQNCPNWNQLQPDDIRSIFGKDSSSILAARLHRENPQQYRELRQTAMDQNLIPRETIPLSLRPPE
jgi:hypothetical protein